MSMQRVIARLDAYEKLIRLDKPIGILLLAWPTLWALWLASRGLPNPLVLWLFLLGTVLMRSAGCAINDYADREFAAHVERTRARPLAAGLIRPWEALAIAAVLALVSFAIVLQFNALTVMLSVPALAIAAIYPFTKRFFWLPRRGSVSPSGSASRWRSPRSSGRCRPWHGGSSPLTFSGPSPTTPSTRWSTVRTT